MKKKMFWRFLKLSLPILCTILTLLSGQPLFPRQHGDLCDWRSPAETCDQNKGLACSYKTQRCTCWDMRTIYTPAKGRCVGKAGEECHLFGGERLCTENAYCLEDETLSSIPICLCLKGYFKGPDGNCIRKSKFGEFCDLPSKHNSLSSLPTNSNCEAESGLQCINYTCQCESNQIYDPNRELCISMAGMPCSKSLNNCIENSECNEKMYAYDHISGETKMIGHKCSCNSGLKVTEDGFCAVEAGGKCRTSSECLFSEGLTCINGKCQCHPLSQVYDRRVRRCLNLVGTRCQGPTQKKQDRHSLHTQENLQDAEQARMDLAGKPQTSYATFPVSEEATASAESSSSLPPTSSSSASTTKATTSPAAVVVSSTTSSSSGTTPNPISIISSRNLSSRNFKYLLNPISNTGNYSRPHFIAPRHYKSPIEIQREYADFFIKHRSSDRVPVAMECVAGAECLPSSPTSNDYYCTCKAGTTETVMRTCLLNHGVACGDHKNKLEFKMDEVQPPFTLECNVYEGLVCQNDKGTCECGDPMLKYDNETRSCLSSVGNPCGRMRLNSKLINSFNYHYGDMPRVKEGSGSDEDFSDISPFSIYRNEPFIYINCEAGAACVDKSVHGQLKQVCHPQDKFPQNRFGVAFASR